MVIRMQDTDSNPPVILLAGKSDRQMVAVMRSFDRNGIPYYISLPESVNHSFWELTKYKEKIIGESYHNINNSKKFIQSVGEIQKKYGSIVLFPIGGSTPRKLIKLKPELPKNVKLPMSGILKYDLLDSYSNLLAVANKYDISVPDMFVDMPNKNKIPFIAKPKTNHQGFCVLLINSLDRYDNFVKDDNKGSNTHFFQEYINGSSYYYCAVYDNGEMVRDFTQKTISQQPRGQSVIKARPAVIPKKVINKFNTMVNDLQWTGPLMAEFRLENDEYNLIEINPRFWGPLQIAIDNNMHFPTDLYHIALDQDVPESYKQKGRPLYGYYRLDGYIEGYWSKFKHGGNFEIQKNTKNNTYIYNDVWNRSDTRAMYIYKNLFTILEPIYKCTRSPSKVLTLIKRKTTD